MKLEEWKKLQNGSDIRGLALAGGAGESPDLTTDVAETLGKSFAAWLRDQGLEHPRVTVGMDSRITGPMLKEAFSKGLTALGVNVLDCGLASTPAMFMTTIDDKLEVDGAVMMTASHLPYNRNGMKFFTSRGGFDKRDIDDLLHIAAAGDFPEPGPTGTIHEIDFISDYAAFLVRTIREGVQDPVRHEQPLAGFKIIVDAGNGAGRPFPQPCTQP
jgi:phosphomannomutase